MRAATEGRTEAERKADEAWRKSLHLQERLSAQEVRGTNISTREKGGSRGGEGGQKLLPHQPPFKFSPSSTFTLFYLFIHFLNSVLCIQSLLFPQTSESVERLGRQLEETVAALTTTREEARVKTEQMRRAQLDVEQLNDALGYEKDLNASLHDQVWDMYHL